MKDVIVIATPGTESDSSMVNITLEGDVCLHNISEIKKQLVEYFEEYDEINIETQNITSFDITAIQLLLAMEKSAEESNKKFSKTITLPENIKTVLMNSGFSKILA